MPHVIHLRSAWDITSSAQAIRHSRNFGRPRTLEAHERVWLVCQSVPGPSEISLNGNVIGETHEKGPFAVEITNHLQPRNRIQFSVTSADPLGEVSIEIRAT
jgi:hypothetical protein